MSNLKKLNNSSLDPGHTSGIESLSLSMQLSENTLDMSLSNNEKSSFSLDNNNSAVDDFLKKLGIFSLVLEIKFKTERKEFLSFALNKLYLASNEKFRINAACFKLGSILKKLINLQILEAVAIFHAKFGGAKMVRNQRANFIQAGQALKIRRKLAVAPPATDNILRTGDNNNLKKAFKMFKEAEQSQSFLSQFKSQDFIRIHKLCKATKMVDSVMTRKHCTKLLEGLGTLAIFSESYFTKKGKKILEKITKKLKNADQGGYEDKLYCIGKKKEVTADERMMKFVGKFKVLNGILTKSIPSFKSKNLHKYLLYDQALFQIFRVVANRRNQVIFSAFEEIIGYAERRTILLKTIQVLINNIKHSAYRSKTKYFWRWKGVSQCKVNIKLAIRKLNSLFSHREREYFYTGLFRLKEISSEFINKMKIRMNESEFNKLNEDKLKKIIALSRITSFLRNKTMANSYCVLARLRNNQNNKNLKKIGLEKFSKLLNKKLLQMALEKLKTHTFKCDQAGRIHSLLRKILKGNILRAFLGIKQASVGMLLLHIRDKTNNEQKQLMFKARDLRARILVESVSKMILHKKKTVLSLLNQRMSLKKEKLLKSIGAVPALLQKYYDKNKIERKTYAFQHLKHRFLDKKSNMKHGSLLLSSVFMRISKSFISVAFHQIANFGKEKQKLLEKDAAYCEMNKFKTLENTLSMVDKLFKIKKMNWALKKMSEPLLQQKRANTSYLYLAELIYLLIGNAINNRDFHSKMVAFGKIKDLKTRQIEFGLKQNLQDQENAARSTQFSIKLFNIANNFQRRMKNDGFTMLDKFVQESKRTAFFKNQSREHVSALNIAINYIEDKQRLYLYQEGFKKLLQIHVHRLKLEKNALMIDSSKMEMKFVQEKSLLLLKIDEQKSINDKLMVNKTHLERINEDHCESKTNYFLNYILKLFRKKKLQFKDSAFTILKTAFLKSKKTDEAKSLTNRFSKAILKMAYLISIIQRDRLTVYSFVRLKSHSQASALVEKRKLEIKRVATQGLVAVLEKANVKNSFSSWIKLKMVRIAARGNLFRKLDWLFSKRKVEIFGALKMNMHLKRLIEQYEDLIKRNEIVTREKITRDLDIIFSGDDYTLKQVLVEYIGRKIGAEIGRTPSDLVPLREPAFSQTLKPLKFSEKDLKFISSFRNETEVMERRLSNLTSQHLNKFKQVNRTPAIGVVIPPKPLESKNKQLKTLLFMDKENSLPELEHVEAGEEQDEEKEDWGVLKDDQDLSPLFVERVEQLGQSCFLTPMIKVKESKNEEEMTTVIIKSKLKEDNEFPRRFLELDHKLKQYKTKFASKEENFRLNSSTACSKKVHSLDLTHDSKTYSHNLQRDCGLDGSAKGIKKSCEVCGKEIKPYMEAAQVQVQVPVPSAMLKPPRIFVSVNQSPRLQKVEVVPGRIRPLPYTKVTTIIHPPVKFE